MKTRYILTPQVAENGAQFGYAPNKLQAKQILLDIFDTRSFYYYDVKKISNFYNHFQPTVYYRGFLRHCLGCAANERKERARSNGNFVASGIALTILSKRRSWNAK